MSSDFAVEYGVLETYSAQMSTTTGNASSTIESTRVDSACTAMPGGLASGAAGLLQGRWEAAAQRVTTHLREHPEGLRTAAAEYRRIEDTNQGLVREQFGSQ